MIDRRASSASLIKKAIPFSPYSPWNKAISFVKKVFEQKALCREACPDSIRLASHINKAPSSRSGRHEFESPVWLERGALSKVERSLGSGLSAVVISDMIIWSCHAWHIAHILSSCIRLTVFLVTDRLTCHGRQYFDTKLSPYALLMWREHCKEAFRDSDYVASG